MTVQTLAQPAQNANTIETTSIIQKSSTWQAVAARRLDEIQRAIPKEHIVPPHLLETTNKARLVQSCGLLTTRELSIIARSAVKLLECIRNRIFTAVEVTRAFCKSAAVAHQAANCLAWVMFDEALAHAAELDGFMSIHGKPKGPLHGLPISVKEHVFLTGTPATSGFIAWADDISKSDALIVKVLRDAGAVFHVKTTNPQGLMALETVSNLYGITTNPFNTRLTPGGSSGGEAALIAMRGSVLGIGTDIGGSIRVPSAFCGLFGLKPSVARLPHGGLSGAHGGMENITGVVGPLATCVEDMRFFCKVLLDSQPWLQEPSLVQCPWKSPEKISKPLKIGVIWHDGVVQPHPPVSRCLRETASALQKAGHTIVSWDTRHHRDLVKCVDKFYFLDAGEEFLDILDAGSEPQAPLLKWILERSDSRPCTVPETWKLNQLRNTLQIAYAAQWNAAGIDIILCPTNASVASAHCESTYWGYSSVFNILDYSSVVFPVGTVKETDTWTQYPRASKVPLSEEDGVYEMYYGDGKLGPEKYEGAPVSLQLVSRRYREEEALEMLERILQDIRKAESK